MVAMRRLAGCVAALQAVQGAVLVSETALPSFEAFVQAQGRGYKEGSAEFQMRRGIYDARKADAEAQNRRAGRLWTATVNHLSDWTAEEMQSLFGWDGSVRPGSSSAPAKASPARSVEFLARGIHPKAAANATSEAGAKQAGVKQAPIPEGADWTQQLHSLKRTIHSQGACGSCWAIAASTTLEAHVEHHTGTQRTFSAQQMVACVPNPQECGGQGGCRGATVELAFDWVHHHGCADEFQVPYTGNSGTCSAAPVQGSTSLHGNAVSGMTGWTKLPENSYEAVMRATAEKGPVAVSVAADHWVNYNFGIFDGCPKDAIINHAVVLVGYGKDMALGKDYWHLQNSWGGNWGDQGRIRLLRQPKEQEWCGTDRQPEVGSGCKGGPPQVTVCGMCGILYDTVIPNF